CRRAFIIGSYCRFGHEREIGYVSLGRAEYLGALLLALEPGTGYQLTYTVGYAPGGGKITLPDGPIWDAIIAEASVLLESANEEPQQRGVLTAPRTTGAR